MTADRVASASAAFSSRFDFRSCGQGEAHHYVCERGGECGLAWRSHAWARVLLACLVRSLTSRFFMPLRLQERALSHVHSACCPRSQLLHCDGQSPNARRVLSSGRALLALSCGIYCASSCERLLYVHDGSAALAQNYPTGRATQQSWLAVSANRGGMVGGGANPMAHAHGSGQSPRHCLVERLGAGRKLRNQGVVCRDERNWRGQK